MSVSERIAAPNRPGDDAATSVWRHRHAIPLALTVAVAFTLAGLVLSELTGSPADPDRGPIAQLVSNAAPSQTSTGHDPARALPDDLLTRPLFAASRHPPLVDPTVPTSIAVDDPPHLVGTLMTGRHDRTALLAVASLPKLQAVHEGDTLGRYRIMAIRPGEVLADGPSGQITLHVGPGQRATELVQPSRIEAAHNAVGAPDQDE